MEKATWDFKNLANMTKPFTVGFDSVLAPLSRISAMDHGFPPYDISRKDDRYYITMAVAGYREEHLSVETRDGCLWVKGSRPASEDGHETYHRGLAVRSFERKYLLAEGVTVESVTLSYGLLQIELLEPVPEEATGRSYEIKASSE